MPCTAAPSCKNEDGVKRGRHERHSLVTLGHPPSYEKLDVSRMSFAV